MNRIEEYYEVACKFVDLPDMARYMLVVNFHGVNFHTFCDNPDDAAIQAFRNAIKTPGKWEELKSIVNTFTETRSKKNVSYLH